MKNLLYVLGFAALAIIVARFIPVDTEPFHEDPAEPETRRSEVRLIGPDAPRFPADADTVLTELSHIASRDWSVGRVEGSIDEGMITFVARSRVFGFRDFLTVQAIDDTGAAKLSAFARPRFNVYDWGVNRKRLDRWLGELEQTLGR